MQYIELQQWAFWDAINDKVLDVLIEIIEWEIDLKELVDEEYNSELEQYNETIDKLIESWVPETEARITPTPRKFTKAEYANYWFQKLIEKWKMLTYDISTDWEITVNVFEKDYDIKRKIKLTYSVSI